MKHIFILGSKGIPSHYGGFETFVEQLTARRRDKEIRYHVACLSDSNRDSEHNGAHCFHVKVPNIGPAKAVLYDWISLRRAYRKIRRDGLTDSAIYILACRIGPFLAFMKRKFEKMGVPIYVNPDGHEWKRSKWNRWVKKYWKWSEKLMIKHTDEVICDSKGIEEYIQTEYAAYSPSTTYLSYGADLTPSKLDVHDDRVRDWMSRNQASPGSYYLMVGRFVPENNYELVIREFMQSQTKRDLIIISNVEKNAFYESLNQKTGFDGDPRIKFAGTVYDQELLKKIRELAYGYIHGHEVGGTNPSLLEALASTPVNVLLRVVFNTEVGGEGAIYFTHENRSLSNRLNDLDHMNELAIRELQKKARDIIAARYDWTKIVSQYEAFFVSEIYQEVDIYERYRIGGRKRDASLSVDEVGLQAASSDL